MAASARLPAARASARLPPDGPGRAAAVVTARGAAHPAATAVAVTRITTSASQCHRDRTRLRRPAPAACGGCAACPARIMARSLSTPRSPVRAARPATPDRWTTRLAARLRGAPADFDHPEAAPRRVASMIPCQDRRLRLESGPLAAPRKDAELTQPDAG